MGLSKESTIANKFKTNLHGYDKLEVNQHLKVLYDKVKDIEALHIDYVAAESDGPSVVIVNAKNSVTRADIEGADLLIILFDRGNKSECQFAENIACLAPLSDECFIVCVAVSSLTKNSYKMKFADTVISVSSNEDAVKVVKCLYDTCTEKSFICNDFMDFMWVMRCGFSGYFAYGEVEYSQGNLPKLASDIICGNSIKDKIGKAKKLLICITKGLEADGKITLDEIERTMEEFWSAVDSSTHIVFTIISKYAGNNVSIGVIATGF